MTGAAAADPGPTGGGPHPQGPAAGGAVADGPGTIAGPGDRDGTGEVRFGHGLIVGKFYPPHAGHHALVEAAARRCAEVTVVVAPSRRESIPLESRLAWLREVHAGDPHVRFVGAYDDHPVDYADPAIWDAHCEVFRRAAGTDRVDAVFSSEAYGAELARRFSAVPVCVDPGRAAVPVSGTAVRADPAGNWRWLSPPVRAFLARRVVVVGAESSGTTTMARALAAHYRTRWVPEYGRELTARKLAELRVRRPDATVFDVRWDRADFREVVRGQRAAEEAAARLGGPLLVCDTDTRATAVWEERYLGSASPEVLAAAGKPDLYLLTDHAGVPFDDDGLRDGEHLRGWMTARFREVLAATGVPVVELRGPHPRRLAAAVAACDTLLAAGWSFAEPITPRR
ncbi:AAA family ATPase [Micromonospora sp. NPDC049559]|uniref:AAA family ATPase n=1 Tax=Micromonospora sp. NPDC049559 TaxID=3155923 RepID=UPI003422575B